MLGLRQRVFQRIIDKELNGDALHIKSVAIQFIYNFGPAARKPPGGVTPQPPIMIRELNGSRSLYVVVGSATIDFLLSVSGVGASIVWTV